MASPATIERKWYVVDATGYTLGRLSSEIAKVLRGKNKPIFTPHMDCGDYVIVVNAEKIKVTGKKLDLEPCAIHRGTHTAHHRGARGRRLFHAAYGPSVRRFDDRTGHAGQLLRRACVVLCAGFHRRVRVQSCGGQLESARLSG